MNTTRRKHARYGKKRVVLARKTQESIDMSNTKKTTLKNAYFVIGTEGSGTYMLAEAFVAAGCTYCDKDDLDDFLTGQEPDLLVLRRSIPHAGIWPHIGGICRNLYKHGYLPLLIAIVRDSLAASKSVERRGGNGDLQNHALQIVGKALSENFGRFISYEYFTYSRAYRKSIFESLELPEPTGMEFYDGNKKYYR